MAENHITVQLNQTDLNDLDAVVNAGEESHDLPGSINGQPVVVRFRAEEPDDDETIGPDGEFLPRGRCDTCGAPCDEEGCTTDRRHKVALDVESSPRPLHKTTIVIWSEYPGTSVKLSDLAREAEQGDAYCSRSGSVLVPNPSADPDWDDTEFFGVSEV